MQYKYWIRFFSKDKTLVGTYDLCHVDSVHTIRRYIDGRGILWEIAITYTNKVVARQGIQDGDEPSIKWAAWETIHEVEID